MSTVIRTPMKTLQAGRRFLIAVVFAAVLCAQASPAFARQRDEDETPPDGRLMGYAQPQSVGGGTMMTYALLAFLGVIAIGVTFKSANRSHLD